LTPGTTAQATFGGTVGYVHLAPATNAVPLTVSGINSQTADIMDWTLTSGGTLAMALTASGVLNVGSQTVQSTTAGDAQFGRTASAGEIILGGATHSGTLDYGATTGQQFTLTGGSLKLATGPAIAG